MHTAIFLVGPPGVGKTTTARELLPPNYTLYTDGKVKWTLASPWAFVGHYGTGTFDGGDTVPNDGWIPCMEYWEREILPKAEYKYTLFDGDRFSHANCESFLIERGVRVLCVHLTASDKVLEDRRRERGSDQNPTWLKGRVSKARNFADRFKPKDNSLFDMFGGFEEEASGESRLLEIQVENLSPSDVGRNIFGFLSGIKS